MRRAGSVSRRKTAAASLHTFAGRRYPADSVRTAYVKGLYWQGDERLPEGIRQLFGDRDHCIVFIDEWMAGQGVQQLGSFQEKVAFRFLLKAPGHEDVQITGKQLKGNCSSGGGAFQGFVVGLTPAELAKLAPGVAYALVPVAQHEEYTWRVKPGVQLVRP